MNKNKQQNKTFSEITHHFRGSSLSLKHQLFAEKVWKRHDKNDRKTFEYFINETMLLQKQQASQDNPIVMTEIPNCGWFEQDPKLGAICLRGISKSRPPTLDVRLNYLIADAETCEFCRMKEMRDSTQKEQESMAKAVFSKDEKQAKKALENLLIIEAVKGKLPSDLQVHANQILEERLKTSLQQKERSIQNTYISKSKSEDVRHEEEENKLKDRIWKLEEENRNLEEDNYELNNLALKLDGANLEIKALKEKLNKQAS